MSPALYSSAAREIGARDNVATASARVPRARGGNVAAAVVMIAFAGAGAWAVGDIGLNFATLAKSADNAANFLSRMFPLDFPPVAELLSLITQTLAIVFLATVLSVVLSIPTALAAAGPTRSGKASQGAARVLIVLCRAVPDLVLAIVFLRVFGLGAIGGILAMGIHSVGMVAKLYADAIEELSDGPRQAAESTGASRSQQIWAAIPQALFPQIVATALHRFDINLRTSVLLGYVGVGGIGLAISQALSALNYQRAMALAGVVLVLCIVVELISGSIRAAVLRPAGGAVGGTWVDRLWRRRAGARAGGNSTTSPRASRSPAETKEDAGVRLTPPWDGARIGRAFSVLLVLALVWLSLDAVDISARALWEGVADLPATAALFFPPEAPDGIAMLLNELWVTVEIALAATFLGALIAIPIGVLAARNVVAHRLIHSAFRVFIVMVRGIPELILAIIFVIISGLGAVAGTLALTIGAVGLLSKLVADSLEETDPGVQESVCTSGASDPQVFFAATLRQAAPAFVAHTMYLLDTNIRSATLLGVVGAGGIGFQLLNAARVNEFGVVTAIVLLMIAVVLAVEALAMWLRAAVR